MTNFNDEPSFPLNLPPYDFVSSYRLLHVISRAFEGLPYPIAVVDFDRVVQCANQKMINLSKEESVLSFVNGSMIFSHEQTDKKISNILFEFMKNDSNDIEAKEVSVFEAGNGKIYLAKIGRLVGYQLMINAKRATAAVISLKEVHSTARIDADVLQDVFDLSSREADIANRLLAGDDVGSMARDLGVSVGTVEARLKAVLKKTGCRGQEELVAILRQLQEAL